MRGLPQKQNARRADKIRLCGHLGRYKKIVKKTYIIYYKLNKLYVTVLIVSNRTVKLVEAAINKEKGYYYRERN